MTTPLVNLTVLSRVDEPLHVVIKRMASSKVSMYGIALVVDENMVLHGVINNGDVLRLVAAGIDLLTPVLMILPKEQGQIKTGKTRWDFGRQELTTKADVLARLKQATIRGRGFRVNQVGERVTIPSSCELIQPDQHLSAQRCSWNWGDDSVVAEGDVVLKRTAFDQTTRASRLEGVLNADGEIRFGAPGRRVTSTIKFKTPNQSDGANRSPVSF